MHLSYPLHDEKVAMTFKGDAEKLGTDNVSAVVDVNVDKGDHYSEDVNGEGSSIITTFRLDGGLTIRRTTLTIMTIRADL